jgi:hypothetical protein
MQCSRREFSIGLILTFEACRLQLVLWECYTANVHDALCRFLLDQDCDKLSESD